MKSVRWLLAAVVAAVLALTGCSTPGAGVAATVNGVSITAERVEMPVRTLGADGDAAGAHATVLTYAIRAEVARTLAAQQNIQLTGEPRTAFLTANANLAQYVDDPTVSGFIDDVADTSIVTQRVGEDAFLSALQGAAVRVNPRYGSWSVETAAVAESGGQLSQPWVTPSAPA